MNVVGILLLVAGLVLAASVVVGALTLWTRHLHPLRILTTALGAASIIGLIGLTSIVPSGLWWVVWVVVLVLIGGVVRATVRALRDPVPTDLSDRRRRLATRPTTPNLVVECIFPVVVLAVAIIAG